MKFSYFQVFHTFWCTQVNKHKKETVCWLSCTIKYKGSEDNFRGFIHALVEYNRKHMCVSVKSSLDLLHIAPFICFYLDSARFYKAEPSLGVRVGPRHWKRQTALNGLVSSLSPRMWVLCCSWINEVIRSCLHEQTCHSCSARPLSCSCFVWYLAEPEFSEVCVNKWCSTYL